MKSGWVSQLENTTRLLKCLEREVWQALGKTSQGKEAAGILQQACMLQP